VKITNQKRTYFSILLLFFITIGCKSLKTVSFKTPVDTTSKIIDYQEKKIYSIEDIGVFASNKFDAARLNGFEKVNDSTIKAIIKPENTPINNSAYYSFQVWSKQNKTIYIEFDYPKGFKHRYIPKIKTVDTDWKISNPNNSTTENKVTTFKISVSKEPIWVSAQEIISSSDTEKWYANLIEGKKSYVHIKSVGKSKLGRNMPVLDIYKGEKKGKPIIVLLTRQHPPEVTGFFAFQEFMKTLLTENNISNDFFNKYRVLAFPIMNPDGVDLGHWRHNAYGVDTNRDWSEYNQIEVKNVVKFITQTSKKDNGEILLGIDFHSTYKDVFYTNKIREGTTLPNFIEDWFTALENNIDDYKVNEKPGNSNKPVSKGWFLYGQNAVGITYEIGDSTPRDRIKLIGKVTAEQMMNILLNK
jgi:hypothetical protein